VSHSQAEVEAFPSSVEAADKSLQVNLRAQGGSDISRRVPVAGIGDIFIRPKIPPHMGASTSSVVAQLHFFVFKAQMRQNNAIPAWTTAIKSTNLAAMLQTWCDGAGSWATALPSFKVCELLPLRTFGNISCSGYHVGLALYQGFTLSFCSGSGVRQSEAV
jgi:hypothetical protein